MKLSEALDFFKNLIEKSNKKSESKIYQGFITILSNLKNRDLTDQQLNSIELELDSLDLSANSENRKKYLRKKYNEFTIYLNTEFSFIVAGHYTSNGMLYGMMLGTGIGIALGTAFGAGTGTAIGLSMGTGIGMVFGMIFGAAKDNEAKKQNRVLN